MRVVLVSPYPDITSFGVRTLSAWLRSHGVAVRCVFLPDPRADMPEDDTGSNADDATGSASPYPSVVLDDLATLCQGADLVGISLMTNYLDHAIQLTTAARRTGAPVIWGGVHATIRPEECLDHADFVAIGDAEETLLELVRALALRENAGGEAGDDPSAIPGLWGRWNKTTFRNGVRPLSPNLDGYPSPDWSHDDHFLLHHGRVVPCTPELTRMHLAGGTVSRLLGRVGYQTMTGRGCPHQCSYCINDAVKRLYGARNYLRWRSVEHVMAELEEARRVMPWIGFVWISDDAFFARPLKEITAFAEAYRRRVGLPFTCLASPLTMREDKLAALVEAGLVYLQMGVQSGSPRIQEIFHRQSMHNEKILEAMAIIHRFKDRLLPPSYDFILDTPWETEADKVASLRLVARIPKPFRLQPFSLVLYPGTALRDRAAAEGLLTDERRDVYTKSYVRREITYLNLLVLLAKSGRMPSRLLLALLHPLCLRTLGAPALRPWLGRGLRLAKGLRDLAKGVLARARPEPAARQATASGKD